MCDSTAGPSGAKRPKLGKRTFEQTVPLTQDDLERYLLDSDDDVGDPDFEESDVGWDGSSDSDEELDLSVLEENTPDVSDNNLDLATPQRPTPQLKRKAPAQAPADVVIWDAVEDNMTQIPFTKQRELLVQPNDVDFSSICEDEKLLEEKYIFVLGKKEPTWQDMRSKVKTKQASIKRHARDTGEGPPLPTKLKQNEEDILSLISNVAVNGHSSVQESSAHFVVLAEVLPAPNIINIQKSETVTPQETIVAPTPTSVKKHNISSARKLQAAASAAELLSEKAKEKLQMKREYYKRKLEIMKAAENRKRGYHNRMLEM
ncbi:unnamed protein product [Phaedon cochleariae]|uniref:Uncharacterized protein n=1 Tax=Phaedon cochleariae TaxID=80249 RepID=A0A9N9SL91_PHACE|nr:unnamed protein product [Phaedon cochleariae]